MHPRKAYQNLGKILERENVSFHTSKGRHNRSKKTQEHSSRISHAFSTIAAPQLLLAATTALLATTVYHCLDSTMISVGIKERYLVILRTDQSSSQCVQKGRRRGTFAKSQRKKGSYRTPPSKYSYSFHLTISSNQGSGFALPPAATVFHEKKTVSTKGGQSRH